MVAQKYKKRVFEIQTFRDDGIIYGRLGRSPITWFGKRTLKFGVRAPTFALRTLTFGVRALTFALRTLTFEVQTPSSVCEHLSLVPRPVRVSDFSNGPGNEATNTYVRCAIDDVRTLTFGVQTPSSVCDRCVWYANIYVRMQTLKNHFFSYHTSQLFIRLQGNKVLIDLGGRFHGAIAACSNNRPPPSLG